MRVPSEPAPRRSLYDGQHSAQMISLKLLFCGFCLEGWGYVDLFFVIRMLCCFDAGTFSIRQITHDFAVPFFDSNSVFLAVCQNLLRSDVFR